MRRFTFLHSLVAKMFISLSLSLISYTLTVGMFGYLKCEGYKINVELNSVFVRHPFTFLFRGKNGEKRGTRKRSLFSLARPRVAGAQHATGISRWNRAAVQPHCSMLISFTTRFRTSRKDSAAPFFVHETRSPIEGVLSVALLF